MAIFTVGPNSTYPSIAAAMAAAGPGDTIQLEPGYSNESAVVTHDGMIITGEASSMGIVLQLGAGIATVTLAGAAPFDLLDSADGNGIVGNDGDNLITVAAGADAVAGGLGEDRLFVDYRLATGAITGNSTSNVAEAGGRLVTIVGGFDHFTIWTGSGADTITTGAGDDDIRTGEGVSTVTAGEGFNYIVGGSGADTITAGSGGNFVDGGDGTNTITTGGGDDEILSGSGPDTIVTGGGNDVVTVAGGADTVDSGIGSDRLIVDYSAALTAVAGGVTGGDLASGYSGHIADLNGATVDFVGIEDLEVTTGSGNDDITTGAGDDVITTGAGNDAVDGGDGSNDRFELSGDRADYDVTDNGDGSFTIVDLRSGSPDGTDIVTGIENVGFADGTMAITGILNNAPVAVDDVLAATEDTPVTYAASAIIGNDTDIEDDPRVIAAVSNASGGTAVLNVDGTVTFTPTADFNGIGGFDYQVSDGDGTDTGHATVNIGAVNDTPIVTVAATLAATEQTVSTIDATAAISDADLDARNGGNGDYAGATLGIANNGGANANDLFTIGSSSAFTVSGANLLAAGLVFATFSGGNGSQLSISFTSSATTATTMLVNAVLDSIRYTYTGNTPPLAGVDVAISLDDGAPANASQGSTAGHPALGIDIIHIDIVNTPEVAPNASPSLSGVATSVTFAENTVNTTPQLIDPNVTFADAEGNFSGGTLTVSGLLAEDRLSVRNEGTTTGLIGVAGSNITYGGTTIGSFTGGVGNNFTVTFNASATSTAADALLQNLAYADVSDTPTPARALTINVVDAAGGDIEGAPSLAALTGTNNPFSSFSTTQSYILPTGIDFDSDGDIDLAVGTDNGTLLAFRNNGNGTFTQLTGAANPFNGFDVGSFSSPAAGDVDNDGDLDLVVGADTHLLATFRNNGDGTFTQLTAGANPFHGLNFNTISQPSSGDFDGDGDSDFIVTEATSTIHSFRNNGNGTFTELTGVSNPFGAFVGQSVGSAFVDVDLDGDSDVVMGRSNGTLVYGRNNGTFTQLTGASNPFNGLDTGSYSSPVFIDIDGDNDLDMISGSSTRVLTTYRNNAVHGATITVNVTPEAENSAPVVDLNGADAGTSATLAYVENATSAIAPTATVTDAESSNFDTGTLTVSFTANGAAEDRLTILDIGNGAGQIGVSGGTVKYADVVIGTFTGGADGSTPLIVTLNASATPAAVQALVRAIAYADVSDTPSTASRTVQFVVTDGDGGTSNAATATIDLTATDDAAVLATGSILSYTEQASPVTVASGLTVADIDSAGQTSATVTISTGLTVGDTLAADVTGTGIAADYVAATGVLTLTGSDTLAHYQQVLRSVTFANTSNDDPTASNASRTISFVIHDGAVDSNLLTSTVNVVAVNDAPAGTSATITAAEDSFRLLNAHDLGFSDVDGTFAGVAITGVTGGKIYFDADGTAGAGDPAEVSLPQSYTAQDLIDGKVGFKAYQDVNGASIGTITFAVVDNEGATDGTPNTLTVDVDAVNDSPALEPSPAPVAATEQTAVAILTGITVADVDLDARNGGVGDYAGAGFSVNRNPASHAEDMFSLVAGSNFTIDGNDLKAGGLIFATVSANADGRIAISFTSLETPATSALVDEVIQSIRYTNSSDTPPASVSLAYGFTDGSPGGGQGAGATSLDVELVTVNLTAGNDAANITGPTTGDVTEAGGIDNGAAGAPTATGDLDSTDVDGTNDVWQAVAAGAASINGYGSYELSTAGVWTYTLDDTNAAVQALGAGDPATDSFTATTADGTAQLVTIAITGSNDTAIISASPSEDMAVTEAGGTANATAGDPSAGGQLSVADVDEGEAVFQTPASLEGIYGSFTVNALTGAWGYTLDNDRAATQALNAGDPVTDTLTVTSADGTSYDIIVDITGSNDKATITASSSEDVMAVEAGGIADAMAGDPIAGGQLSVADLDEGEAVFRTPGSLEGTYGAFTFDTTTGVWGYTLDNARPATQALNADDPATDTLTVSSADGTDSQDIVVNITGANDAAVITAVTGEDTMVIEAGGIANATAGDPGAGGQLTVSDPDEGESSFQVPDTAALTGTYGIFTFDSTNGLWSYALANAQANVQALDGGQAAQDMLAMTSADGTVYTIVVDIAGTNDAPTAPATNLAALDEGMASASIAVGANDVDGDALTYSVKTGSEPAKGSVDFDQGAGTFTYTPNPDADGADSFVILVDDEHGGTVEQMVSVTIAALNDAPVMDLNGEAGGAAATLAYAENDPLVPVAPDATVNDVDSADFDMGTLAIAFGTPVDDNDLLRIVDPTSTFTVGEGGELFYSGTQIGLLIGGNGGSEALEIAFNADATLAIVQGLVRVVGFVNFSNSPVAGDRTLTFTLTDGDGGTSTPVTAVVTVTAVEDPAVANDDLVFAAEDIVLTGSVFADNGNEEDLDPDGPQIQVTAVNDEAVNVGQPIALASGATLVVNIDGTFSYDQDGAFGHLAAFSTETEQFTYTITGGDTATVTVTVTGENDAAVITAVGTSDMTAIEAGGTTNGTAGDASAGGELDVADDDDGEASSLTPASLEGIYGSFTFEAVTGVWGYTLDNGRPATQALNAGDIITDTLTVTSADGTSYDIVVDITGSNDNATITASASEDMAAAEAGGVANGAVGDPTAGGQFSVADVDDGEAVFQTPASLEGAYGTFTFDNMTGVWGYTLDDGRTATQALDAGEAVTDTLTISPADGTSYEIAVNVTGADDLGGPQNDGFVTDELTAISGNVFADNGSGADGDADGPPLQVSAVNGSAAAVGQTIVLPTGATLKLNADGSFDYNPVGPFGYLTESGSGAVNIFGLDSFTYTLAGGGTATVTVTVNGIVTLDDELWGDAGNNTITGTNRVSPHGDTFRLTQGGNENVFGNDGNDGFIFGAAFIAEDKVDGGEGNNDQVSIQGDYSAGLTFGPQSLVNVETLLVLPGGDYKLTSIDANVAPGGRLQVFGTTLGAGDDLTFDGSAETDGHFVIYGGAGRDTLTGGNGNDGFYFGPGNFSQTDTLHGGPGGNDQLGLDGHYSITLGGNFDGIETLVLYRGPAGDLNNFNLTTNDAAVAAGQRLTIFGTTLGTDLVFNGSAETDGSFRFLGGAGNDTLTGGQGSDIFFGARGGDTMNGGGGNDVFIYNSPQESTAASFDRILGFNAGDILDLSGIDANSGTAGDGAFAYIGANAFSGVAGQLRAVQSGGGWTIEGDVNGDGVADLVISVTTDGGHIIVPGDFTF